MAVEIHIKDYLLYDLLMRAQEIGFYKKKNFLHLNVRSAEKRIWKGRQLIIY